MTFRLECSAALLNLVIPALSVVRMLHSSYMDHGALVTYRRLA